MKTRENFLKWAFQFEVFETLSIDKKRFYHIKEKQYVLNILEQKSKEKKEFQELVEDYFQLEKQRYEILENKNITLEKYQINAQKAVEFCAKNKKMKKKSSFIMNPELSSFLAESLYTWYGSPKEQVGIKKKYYFFIPSFLSIKNKEIHLFGLNTLLLDLINYKEVFTYHELFDLVSEAINLSSEDIDQMLIDFLSDQILYYQTIHVVHG